MRVKFKDGSVVEYPEGKSASLVGNALVIFTGDQSTIAILQSEEVESYEAIS